MWLCTSFKSRRSPELGVHTLWTQQEIVWNWCFDNIRSITRESRWWGEAWLLMCRSGKLATVFASKFSPSTLSLGLYFKMCKCHQRSEAASTVDSFVKTYCSPCLCTFLDGTGRSHWEEVSEFAWQLCQNIPINLGYLPLLALDTQKVLPSLYRFW